MPEDATVVGIPGRIVNTTPQSDSDTKKRTQMAQRYGFDAYAVSPDNPDPVAKAIGAMLDHITIMDEKLASVCTEVTKMGGEVCDKALPEIEVDSKEFVEEGRTGQLWTSVASALPDGL